MRKVVYNATYGGFCLSPIAIIEYYRRKGIITGEVYVYSYLTDEERLVRKPYYLEQAGYMYYRPIEWLKNNPTNTILISDKFLGEEIIYSYFNDSLYSLDKMIKDFSGIRPVETLKKEYYEALKYRKIFNETIKDATIYSQYVDVKRHDPDLAAIVEELGPEVAGQLGTKLEIEEVPDGCLYRITDYDGWETVEISDSDWQ